ncbi:MAG: HAMP domain-containing sensor histidine kinase [Deltaproteobacteria bacterium]|nr:HAMP domain-containing sensor histidine kinase [Deltaproteobacteria bacterium]
MAKAKEIVPLNQDDKKLLVEIGRAMTPFEEDISRKWDDLFVKARNGLKESDRAVKDFREAVHLFLTSLSDGDFDAYFKRIDEKGADFAKTKEQYENLILSFHLYEEASFPYLQKSFTGRLHQVLNTLDLLYHNVIAILARSYFRELEREREKFINILAHDLKNPLMGVIGFSKVLMEKGVPEEKRDDYLKRIYNSGKRMNSLIDNALTYGRLKSERRGILNIKEVDTAEAAKEAAAFLLPEAEKVGLSILINGRSEKDWKYLDPVKVNGDGDLILRAVGNYISNAVKYAGSRIEVSLQEREEDVLISVKDDGPGIPTDHIDLVFGDYYMVPGGKPGTGLGLPSVRMIAELHNGKAWVESEGGKGSTFYLRLPKKQGT